MSSAAFVHRFVPATTPEAGTILALHGTGGNEDDLIPLASAMAPGAAILSPRGQVLERGMPRFFRRLAEGVFDLDDLHARTAGLAAFVADAARQFHFDPARVFAMGYSNGANIAASLLLSNPDVLAGAVLLRAMVPFEPDTVKPLGPRPVLLSAGRRDPIVPQASTTRLADLLRSAGADVTLWWEETGHGLARAEIDRAGQWLQPYLMGR
jgi:phospholipase/carboxylesterase